VKPSVSVIIVTWNAEDIIKDCLQSVFATKYPNLEIIIVDNNSQDHTLSKVKKMQKKLFKLITNGQNLGFPKAINQGLRVATGDYLLLLNADASLPADFFQKAEAFFADYPEAAVMGPKLADPDGTPQGSVFPEPSVEATFREFWLGQKNLTAKYSPSPENKRPVSVNAISGACMFFPRRTLEKIGLFTESVFMYYEDLDYCRRIRRSGWNIYFNPQITVTHIHGHASKQTSGRALGYLQQSSLWYNGPLKHYLMWLISWTGQKLFRTA